MSDQMKELEAKLARCVGAINAMRLNIDLVRNYAPGHGTGLNAFEVAKKALDDEIARCNESEFQKAKREFTDGYEAENLNGVQCRYLYALERCRPWAIRSKQDGTFFSHNPCGTSWVPMLFPTQKCAVEYFNHGYSLQASVWEIAQWEGPEQ